MEKYPFSLFFLEMLFCCCSTNGARTTGCPCAKKKKISRWIINLKVKYKITKPLVDKIRENLGDFDMAIIF